jgi:hypothetical protein
LVRSDWVDVMLAGVPPAVIGLLVAIFLIAGWVWIQLLLPLAGVGAEYPFWGKLLIFLAGVPLLLLGAVIYLTLLGSSSSNAPAGYVLQNRQIALAASVALVATIAALHRPLFPLLDRIAHSRVAQVAWRDTLPAVGLGHVGEQNLSVPTVLVIVVSLPSPRTAAAPAGYFESDAEQGLLDLRPRSHPRPLER